MNNKQIAENLLLIARSRNGDVFLTSDEDVLFEIERLLNAKDKIHKKELEEVG